MNQTATNVSQTTPLQDKAENWFKDLRDQLCQAFEAIETEYTQRHGGTPGRFERQSWQRPGGGGGVMSIMRGQVFEKVGVNASTVWGEFAPEFAAQIPGAKDDPRFWASGVSLVAHMRNPHVPAVHMNTRHIVTTKSWFGGGGDLTPFYPVEEDTKSFHQAYQDACDRYNPNYYPEYKQWCDKYFYLPHRQEPRGVGGIFYDNHNSGDLEEDFRFTQDVGKALLDIYPRIVRRRMETPYTLEEREYQLMRRGRYVEFNLLYDRGTLFGLKTDGNTEAILMSMPPEVRWP